MRMRQCEVGMRINLYCMEFQESNEEIQECITQNQVIVIPQEEQIDLKISITRKMNEQMPANQLRAAQRPSRITPHTFFLENPLYYLPQTLSTPCVQVITKVKQNRLTHSLKNPLNLPLSMYFNSEQWLCIFNKLSSQRQDSQSFSGRFKSLDLLLDYNWKSFKQLQFQIHMVGENKEQDSIDSNYQNGNICRVYKPALDLHTKQYYLVIENDLNTYGYNNWFFYRVRNAEKGLRRFNIINIIKKNSFYQQGMLVSIFSMKKMNYEGIKWFKGGDNVTFGGSEFNRDHHQEQHYYTLSFEYNFQYESDQVYFAASQPYTYSRLANLIQQTKKNIKNIELQTKTLGYSIANNILPLLKFSKPNKKAEEAILLIGRQHPCETVGSFIIQQIINQIMKETNITNLLLDHFQIYVVPMVNPDGVIHGYSRTNMAGLDLNRQWSDNILKELTPQSIKIKQYLLNLSKMKKIKYVIDFHGHGKKLNSFLFCCKAEISKQNNRLFPYVISTRQQRFNLASCTYGLSKDKQTTLRALTSSLGIINSYTLQTSLYGWKNENHQVVHFNQSDYQKIATSLLQSLYIIQGDQQNVLRTFGTNRSKLISELIPIIEALEREQRLNDNKDNISDSDPEGDRLDVKDLLKKCENKIIKKKLQQSLNFNQKIILKNNLRSKLPTQNIRQNTRVLSFKNVQSNLIRCQLIKKQAIRKNKTDGRDTNILDFNSQFEIDQGDNDSEMRKKQNLLQRLKQKQKAFVYTKRENHSKGESVQVFNLNRPKLKARLRTESNSTKKKGLVTIRRRTQYSAEVLKSKGKQDSHYLYEHNSQTTQEMHIKHMKSVAEEQFKSYGKKQHTKNLLTDTFSLIKVNNRDKLSQLQKPIKNICLNISKTDNKEVRQLRHSNDNRFNRLNLSVQQQSSKEKLSKLKTFKQFVLKEGNMFPKRMAKQSSTNYYYFPIL